MKAWFHRKQVNRKRLIRGIVAAVCFCVLCFVLWLMAARLAPFPDEKLTQLPENLRVLDASGNLMRRILAPGEVDLDCVSLSSTGDWCGPAIISAEDKRFYRHGGIDPIALVRAAVLNVVCRRVVSGGSTISTQVIRMMEPRRRTLATKVIEAFRATQLEQRYSKEEILEQYLNRAPMGGNRQGVAVGARRYYGKEAADLSVGEAALLLGLPQSPSRFRPDRYPERAEKRRRYVLRRLVEDGVVAGIPSSMPKGSRWVSPPYAAAQFCDWAVQELAGAQGDVKTSLDPGIQRAVEMAQNDWRQDDRMQSVDGLAVVVMDPFSGQVLAMTGGAGTQGVNLATRRRAPGSTLKPFAYAQAMQQGWLTPDSLLLDKPRNFSGYHPKNMSQKWDGEVTAAQALVRSLNAPALSVVEKLGGPSFFRYLRSMGFQFPRVDPETLGLGLVLGGGVEVSLLELVQSYGIFANGGRMVRASPLAEDRVGEQAMHPGVAWWMTQVLSGPERDRALFDHSADVPLPELAFKTGTSHGHRDAWAIGWTPRLVIGVWVGRVDGCAVPGMSGLSHAAPLLGQIVKDLALSGESWPPAPESMRHHQGRRVISGVTRLNDAFRQIASSDSLEIRSPADGAEYVLSPDAEALTLALELNQLPETPVHLFVDGEWKLTMNGERIRGLSMGEGRHTLRAVAQNGTAASVTIQVVGW